jgi:ABC-type siderophore export system fused ATPase/permease subunit
VWVLKNVIGDDLMARLIASSRYKDVYEFKQWEANKDDYIREFYEKVIPLFHDIAPSLLTR